MTTALILPQPVTTRMEAVLTKAPLVAASFPVPSRSAAAQVYGLGGRSAATVAAFSASLLLVVLSESMPSLSYHEVLFAQPAKEMLATGNWILPKIAGFPSTHKPPGTEWAIASLMWLTGSQGEAVARLPSALAAVAAALLVAALAARWCGSRVGLVAGLMHATTFYVLQLGLLAKCDMLLTLAVLGAMGAFAVANVESPRGLAAERWWPWAFYGCVTLTYFFKGLIGPTFVFSGCGAYVLLRRDGRGLRFLLNPPGLAGFVLCAGAWFAAAYAQYPKILADQVRHHFGRFEGEMGGGKDPAYYLYMCLVLTLPWAPLIVAGLVRGIRLGLYTLPWWQFAACWMIPGLILLNLSAFKSKHYPAPLLAPLTIVAALTLVSWMRARQQASARSHLAWAGGTLVVAALAAGAAWLWPSLPAAERRIALVLAAASAAGMAAVIYCQSRRRGMAALRATFATVWVVIAGILHFIAPRYDSYRNQTELSVRVNEIVPDGAPLDLVHLPGNGENQIIYYLEPPLRRYDHLVAYGKAVRADPSERYVLAPISVRDQLAKQGSLQELATVPPRRRQPAEQQLVLYKLTRRATGAAAPGAPPP